MILEIARLGVILGQQQDFERAFARAEGFIMAMPGYLSHQLTRCIEQDNEYVLQVYWETMEHHVEGFRQAPEYRQWRALLHHFYMASPDVRHYRAVQAVAPEAEQARDEGGPVRARMYQPGDFEQTWPLFHAVAAYYARDSVPATDETREYVRDRVLGPDSDVRLALAVMDGKAVGLATFSIMYPSPGTGAQVYLKELYVDTAYRGHGAGRVLMQFVARYGLARGCNRLDWSAEKTNPGALEFYHAVGARPLAHKVYYRLEDDELRAFAGA